MSGWERHLRGVACKMPSDSTNKMVASLQRRNVMNANLESKGPSASPSWKQLIYGLLGLGLSSPAHALGSATASIAGWSIALVIILALAYLFGRRKH
jgi:hypothetical protein